MYFFFFLKKKVLLHISHLRVYIAIIKRTKHNQFELQFVEEKKLFEQWM